MKTLAGVAVDQQAGPHAERMQNRVGWLRFLERFMTDLRIHDRFAQRLGSRP
jgi:hypothetical protein